MSDQFYVGPRDLARGQAVTDEWDAWMRDDTRLASWAFVTAPQPVTERALGAFADWATDVVVEPTR